MWVFPQKLHEKCNNNSFIFPDILPACLVEIFRTELQIYYLEFLIHDHHSLVHISSFSSAETIRFLKISLGFTFYTIPYTFTPIHTQIIVYAPALNYDSSYTVYTVRTGLLTFAQVRLPLSALAGSVVWLLAGRANLLAACHR